MVNLYKGLSHFCCISAQIPFHQADEHILSLWKKDWNIKHEKLKDAFIWGAFVSMATNSICKKYTNPHYLTYFFLGLYEGYSVINVVLMRSNLIWIYNGCLTDSETLSIIHFIGTFKRCRLTNHSFHVVFIFLLICNNKIARKIIEIYKNRWLLSRMPGVAFDHSLGDIFTVGSGRSRGMGA